MAGFDIQKARQKTEVLTPPSVAKAGGFDVQKVRQQLSAPSLGSFFPVTNLVKEVSKKYPSQLETKKPITNKVAEVFVSNRGYSNEALASAKPSIKDKAIATVKNVGEIGAGIAGAIHIGGNFLADKVLPGFDSEKAAADRKEITKKITPYISPGNVEQARSMKDFDAASLVGGLVKPSSLIRIKNALSAVDNIDDARKLLRSSELTDDIITKNGWDKKAVAVKTPQEVEAFIKEVEATNIPPTPVLPTQVATDARPEPVIPTPTIQSVTPPLLKERGFITSVKEVIPEASKVAGQYVPRSTDELSIKASNLIKDNPTLAFTRATTESGEEAVAIASELIKKYSNDADNAIDDLSRNDAYDKAAEVANSIAAKLTESGRAVQAASILGRMTPEGQLRFASREIQKFNEANPTKKIPELSGEDAKFIAEEMKGINQMPDGIDKAMRLQKLQEKVSSLVPTPLWKKITTVWKAGLLTGLKTTGLNLFSNFSHALTEVAKDAPAAAVDSVASLFTGKRTKTFTLRNAFSGIKEGAVKGKRYFSTGFDERNLGFKLDYERVNFGKGVVGNTFRVYTETVFRALGSTDQPFYYASLSRSLMDQALAQGKNLGLKGQALRDHAYKVVENPTDEMVRYGVSDATTAVFQNKTRLGDAAGTIQKLPGVGQIILPFAQTPSAVAMQIIAYSPVGTVKTLFENIGRGKFDQRQFSQGMGRSVIGTAFLTLGYKLAENQLVTLDFPKGDEAEQELWKAEGRKPNSIKINGKWRSPMVLGPVGNIVLMGAHFQKALEKAGSPTEAAAIAAAGVWKSFLEQTFLTGVSNFAQVLQDPAQYAGSYLPNLVGSSVPTIVSDVARATDPLERKTQGGFTADGFTQKVQARIPGARQGLEPDIDILGNERQSVGNPLEILIDPTRPSPSKQSLVTSELRRLMDLDYRVSPTKLGDKNGYDVLTPQQNTALWKKTGEILDSKLTGLFNSKQYQKASDDEREKIVGTFVEKSQNYSRASMVIEVTQGLEGEALRTKLSELKAGGLMTRDVYRAYQEIR